MDDATIQVISIIVSGILGVSGIAIAGLSTYWSSLERVEPLKRHLYEQQTLAATECVSALVELELAVESHHADIGFQEFFENDEQRASFIEQTTQASRNLKRTLYRWSHVAPYQVFAPMAHYLSVVEYASNQREVFSGWASAGYPRSSPWTLLPDYFLASIAAVRDFLGIGPLTAQLAETIGGDETQRRAEVTEKTQALGYLMSHDYRPFGSYWDGYLLTREHLGHHRQPPQQE